MELESFPHFNPSGYTSEFGRFEPSSNTKPARLTGPTIDYLDPIDQVKGIEHTIYINPQALSGTLLESNGTVLGNYGKRLVVLAKAGNTQIPLYRSRYGSSGKREGIWHPFFGHVNNWLVKGDKSHFDEDGNSLYHPRLTEIQELLNQNFRVANWVSTQDNKLAYRQDGEHKITDLKDLFPFHNFDDPSKEPEENEADFNRFTGLYPSNAFTPYTPYEPVEQWIQDVLSHIEV